MILLCISQTLTLISQRVIRLSCFAESSAECADSTLQVGAAFFLSSARVVSCLAASACRASSLKRALLPSKTLYTDDVTLASLYLIGFAGLQLWVQFGWPTSTRVFCSSQGSQAASSLSLFEDSHNPRVYGVRSTVHGAVASSLPSDVADRQSAVASQTCRQEAGSL